MRLREQPGTGDQERQPRQISGHEGAILGRDQPAPNDAVITPRRVGKLTMTEHAQQLECRIRGPGAPRLPMADGAKADAQHLGGLLARQAAEYARVAELFGSDTISPRSMLFRSS